MGDARRLKFKLLCDAALVNDVEGVDEEADADEDGQRPPRAAEAVAAAQDGDAHEEEEDCGDDAASHGREDPADDDLQGGRGGLHNALVGARQQQSVRTIAQC